MRFQFIVCSVMKREAYLCASQSENVVDVVLLPQGLHEYPEKLRTEVQKALERTCDENGNPYDASLLGYGLCSNGIVGLSAPIKMVIPRGHDCMTLLLGSKEKYKEYFESHRGVYWYSSGWIETGSMPGKERYEKNLNEYEKKYGSDNAKYLMETEQQWMKEYNWATYIDWDFPNSRQEREYTKKCAEFLGWKYDIVKGDSSLMQRLLDGQWEEKEFLVALPGHKIEEDLTKENIIKSACKKDCR